jgi:hypothetical protein
MTPSGMSYIQEETSRHGIGSDSEGVRCFE